MTGSPTVCGGTLSQRKSLKMFKVSVVALVVAIPLVAVACTAPAEESSQSFESTLRAPGSEPPDPMDPPAKDAGVDVKGPIFTQPQIPLPIRLQCSGTSMRIEAHHVTQTCTQARPAPADGHWRAESLFPNATESSLRDHFCAYTWVPN